MSILERKLDYLFNHNIALDTHNTPRAIQNAQQMQRLGFYNTPTDRNLVKKHLINAIETPNNIIENFTHSFTDKEGGLKELKIEIRESLLCGRSGKLVKIKSSWEVFLNGDRRFISAEFYGG